MTVPQAAVILNVTRQRVQQLIAKGILPAKKLGRDWRVSEVRVRALILPGSGHKLETK